MPDIKWIKITTEMFDDEKIRIIESMPEADTLIVLWIRLICMAGKTNDNGYIYLMPDIPYSIEQLAAIFGRPLNTVKLAIDTFKHLKMITLSDDGVIFLPAFERHQNLEGMERIREANRKRVAAFRERHSSVSPVLALPEPLRRETKVQPAKVNKTAYGEFKNVLLTDEQYHKLEEKFNSSLPSRIEELSQGIASKGYKYKDHYATILSWARKADKEGVQNGHNSAGIPGNRPTRAFSDLENRE